jgi:hypothetical protein
MGFFDRARELLTGQVCVEVPDNLSQELEVACVYHGLDQRGLEVTDTTSMQCTNCKKWVLVNVYAEHKCGNRR